MDKELETYIFQVDVDDERTGLLRTSIVPVPAIGDNFHLFDEVVVEHFKDEDKRIITGALMIPDLKMLRKFQDGSGYYYCKYSAETIQQTVKKASKDGVLNDLNLNHSPKPEDRVKNVYLIESYFLTEENKPEIFKHLPNGTWIGSFWVEDEKYWEEVIKGGDFHGFSVEIAARVIPEDMIKEEMMAKIEEILESDFTDEGKWKRIESLLVDEKYTVVKK